MLDAEALLYVAADDDEGGPDLFHALPVEARLGGEGGDGARDDGQQHAEPPQREREGEHGGDRARQPVRAALAREELDERRDEILDGDGEDERDEDGLQVVGGGGAHGRRADDERERADPLVHHLLLARERHAEEGGLRLLQRTCVRADVYALALLAHGRRRCPLAGHFRTRRASSLLPRRRGGRIGHGTWSARALIVDGVESARAPARRPQVWLRVLQVCPGGLGRGVVRLS